MTVEIGNMLTTGIKATDSSLPITGDIERVSPFKVLAL